ncbi:Iron ABC transporter permease [[Mycoplasma] cavipharyngis]|uniref:iron chelate uptake ABC transporter family permease subunit n=1 Tax=[Mycoplasma] cavipharyngis TaxID=92757 RepID=UPI0037046026
MTPTVRSKLKISHNIIHDKTFVIEAVKQKQLTTKKRNWINLIALHLIFAVLLFLGLTLLSNGFYFTLETFSIRIWQYLLAIMGGGALGVAGLLLQKTTKNNLADVSILGIGSLNIIFITLYIFSFGTNVISNQASIRQLLPLITIAASILGTSIIYTLTKFGNNNVDKFIIVGIALQFLFEAVSIAILNPSVSTAPGSAIQFTINQITNFSLGKLPDINYLAQTATWRIMIIICSICIVVILLIIWTLRKKIDLIETSEKLALSYGIRVESLKLFLYLLIALLAGIEAAILGNFPLLGILAPNIAKPIFGSQTKTNLWTSFLIGAIMVMIATFVSVNLNTDIPIGFLSTAIITPYFIFIILKRNKR